MFKKHNHQDRKNRPWDEQALAMRGPETSGTPDSERDYSRHDICKECTRKSHHKHFRWFSEPITDGAIDTIYRQCQEIENKEQRP